MQGRSIAGHTGECGRAHLADKGFCLPEEITQGLEDRGRADPGTSFHCPVDVTSPRTPY